MNVLHLTASSFYGGPERQMLGLADALPAGVRTTVVSFPEGGRCGPFLAEAAARGLDAVALRHDFPKLPATVGELAAVLCSAGADMVLCHGYKAGLLGRLAARRVGVPAVAVSRGWTGEDRRVRLYEWLDRRHLPLMDHVVCVSDGQAAKVRRWCRVPPHRLSVIRNAARLDVSAVATPAARRRLLGFLPGVVSRVVVGAGRLSPEKGFGVLVEAAAAVGRADPGAGFVLFGEGVLRPELERRVAALGLTGRVVLPGFRADLDELLPAADVVCLPSFTEGLPNVALEASAAGVPVVATAVGGTPEVVADGETGCLVPSGDPASLAASLIEVLGSEETRRRMGEAGRRRMRDRFTFAAQAAAYLELFARLCPSPSLAEVA